MNDFSKFLADQLDYSRVRLLTSLEGLTDEQVRWQPEPQSPSIGSILLHIGRIDDLHVSRAIRRVPEIWANEGWQTKMALPDPTQFPIELGWTADDPSAAGSSVTLGQLLAYAGATREATKGYLEGASAEELSQEVDDGLERHKGWTAAKHIAHCALHESHHQGQIDYVKGLCLARAAA